MPVLIMTESKKNKILITILILLITISALLHFNLESEKSNTIDNVSKFSIADTSSIQKIVMQSPFETNLLEKNNGHWTINKSRDADPNIIRVLLSVLKQVNVSRSVSKNQMVLTKKELIEEGTLVEIYDDIGLEKKLYVKGNATKTLSLFMDEVEGIPYIVVLPGYDSYVAGIFEIPRLDWQNRLIFNSTWRSLRKLEMLYPNKPKNSFEIRFDLDFFSITGIDNLDTASMMNFVEEFQYFQADRFIEPEPESTYGKLLKTNPKVYLSIEDIDDRKNNRIAFYDQLKGDRMILGKLDNGEIALFDYKRIRKIFIKKSDFSIK